MIKISDKLKFWLALILCTGLYVVHFVNILKFAVNIPFYDEWEGLTSDGFIANPSLSQLFHQHNEHRIFTTKLLTLLLYHLDGWNLATHQALNFIIYGGLIVLLAYIIRKSAPQFPGWVLLAFVVFLLCTISWENHFWAFQTQFHFALLFLLLSIWFLFNESQVWSKILCGVFFSWLSIYSLSSGLVEIVAVLIGYSCFKLLRFNKNRNNRQEIIQMLTVLILIGGAIGLYFVGYNKVEGHPPIALPFQKVFWVYFLNLLAGGFGYISENVIPGIFIFLFFIIPIVGEIIKRRFDLPIKTWVILISSLAILAALGTISMGRANFGAGQSKSPRYAEIIGLLIPLSVAMWAIFLETRLKARNLVHIAFWIFCAYSFSSYWNFARTYIGASSGRNQGVECVRNYYRNGGEANCSSIYPIPIKDRLDFDKTLKLSFIEEMNK